MSAVSVFECPHAILDISCLLPISPYATYPWGEGKPITKEEVSQAIADGRLIATGVFNDDPVNGEKDNIHECSRDEHIQRIAWFVVNYDPAKSSGLRIESSGNIFGDNEHHMAFVGGNHRVAAMLFNGVTDHPVQFNSGNKRIIEALEAFKTWVSMPAHDGNFGYCLLSDDQETWEVDARPDGFAGNKRIWVSNAKPGGMSIARMAVNGYTTSYEVEDEHGERFFEFTRDGDGNEPISVEHFLGKCAEHISVLFADPRVVQEVLRRLSLKGE